MPSSLRTLAGVISSKWREPSKCEACGEDFNCGATLTGCWCSELKLTDDARAELRGSYSGCLCRKCLEKVEADSGQNRER